MYASVDDFAATLGVKPTPALYLSNGNGTLNAFAAQSGWTNNYVVLTNELFANLRHDNREGTRFILGHELGHIRLHHVALWYNLVLCYSQLIPILGPTLSRLREYSCDRNGAALESKGELGLVLLTAGGTRRITCRSASWSTKDATSAVSGWGSPSYPGRTRGPCGGSGGCTSSACSVLRPPSTKRTAPSPSCNRSPTVSASQAHSKWGSLICLPLRICATDALMRLAVTG
jgi:hypothetical protein